MAETHHEEVRVHLNVKRQEITDCDNYVLELERYGSKYAAAEKADVLATLKALHDCGAGCAVQDYLGNAAA